MAKVKLIRGLSYTDGVITATRKNPVVEVEDGEAQNYIDTGFFIAQEDVEEPEPAVEEPDEEPDGDEIPDYEVIEEIIADPESQMGGKLLKDMTIPELETFATYKDVSLKGLKTRKAIIGKLKASLPAEELSGKIYYGSPTMVELQE